MYICQNQTFNIFQLLYTYYLYTVVLFFYIYPFILIFHLFNSYFKISINNKILDKLLFYFLPIFLFLNTFHLNLSSKLALKSRL
jgi:hypothetical protein